MLEVVYVALVSKEEHPISVLRLVVFACVAILEGQDTEFPGEITPASPSWCLTPGPIHVEFVWLLCRPRPHCWLSLSLRHLLQLAGWVRLFFCLTTCVMALSPAIEHLRGHVQHREGVNQPCHCNLFHVVGFRTISGKRLLVHFYMPSRSVVVRLSSH